MRSGALRVLLAVLDRPHLVAGVALLIILALLNGCAALQSVEPIDHPDTFAKCAAADVATTTIGLASGRMVEGNALTKALAIPALGKVAGTVVPLIGLSIAGYYLLKSLDAPAVTTAAAGLTCIAAARNLVIIQ